MEETEVWKSLDFLDFPDYEVSNFGRIKSLNYRRLGKEQLLRPSKDKDGYLRVRLYQNKKGKTFLVHQLVCLAFLENSYNLPEINHLDENKENNKLENLEWCTHIHNINYGTRNERMGKARKGKISPNRKPILQLTKEGEFIKYWDSAKFASEELNIDRRNICNCCKGKIKTAYGFIWRYKI